MPKTVSSFIINLGLVAILFGLGWHLGLNVNNERLMNDEMELRAKAQFHLILLARRWNSDYGGVYVEKRPGVLSNPYLESPDIITSEGKTYTMKIPVEMTEEISEYANREGAFRFHVTSLNPVNPANSPDNFEKKALTRIMEGEEDVVWKEERGKHIIYRYMGALYTEGSCLKCHVEQGNGVGDLRGGISVEFNITQAEKALHSQKVRTRLWMLACVGYLFIYFYLTYRRLRNQK
jgi:hypothetical protein